MHTSGVSRGYQFLQEKFASWLSLKIASNEDLKGLTSQKFCLHYNRQNPTGFYAIDQLGLCWVLAMLLKTYYSLTESKNQF